MNEFLHFIDELRERRKVWLEIAYSSVVDWCVIVHIIVKDQKKCVVNVQHCDMEYAFAKAQVELKEWLLENEGGY